MRNIVIPFQINNLIFTEKIQNYLNKNNEKLSIIKSELIYFDKKKCFIQLKYNNGFCKSVILQIEYRWQHSKIN